jgi:hypothetical protein
MLHFGRDQLFWECRESVACETYPRGLPANLRKHSLIDIKTLDLGDEPKDTRWPARYVSSGSTSPSSLLDKIRSSIASLFRPVTLHEVTLHSSINRPSIFRDWDAAVEMYSLGALTLDRDKLVALSGLADAISISDQNKTQDGYLAGLWQSSLPSHLLWTTETVTRTGGRGEEDSKYVPSRYDPVTNYIAPSWSWASIKGKITFKWCQYNYDHKDYLAHIEFAKVGWTSHLMQFGRYGIVESGYLQISAPLAATLWADGHDDMTAPIIWIYPSDMDQQNAVLLERRDMTNSDAANASTIYFDTPEHVVPEVLTLLPVVGVTKRTESENEMVCGLVLRKKEGTDEYVRLGIFHTMQERACRILKNMPRRTVKIV